MIRINIKAQTLAWYRDGELCKHYSVSTASNGTGNINNSFCTPLGQHKIYQKIGTGLPLGSVLAAREPTGEIYTEALGKQHRDRDWILSRIIWLEGCERDNQNTRSRFIYIHGAPESVPMGKPGSKGCIRMRNQDVSELFDWVTINEKVIITED